MNRIAFARLALTVLCGTQGVAQLAIDLNHTHATHPKWMGHARFHAVWLAVTGAFLAGIETYLIWSPNRADHDFYLAAALAAVLPGAFLAAAATRKLYGGRFSDPDGIPALKIAIRKTMLTVDMNLVAVVIALVVLLAIVVCYRD